MTTDEQHLTHVVKVWLKKFQFCILLKIKIMKIKFKTALTNLP